MAAGRLRVWILAARPKTLSAGAVPVCMGGAMAFGAQAMHWPSFFAALAASLLIQIGANLCNDLYDAFKEADGADRLGPLRVTQAGLVTPREMRRAIVLVFGAALLLGIYLVARGGWPILVIGLASLVFAALYTAGPFPLAYLGLGDPFVLVFFGPVATAGSYYVITRSVSAAALAAGLGPGMISTALLTVNNLRDVDSDRRVGKKTLAVRLGRRFARAEYLVLMAGAALAGPALALFSPGHPWLWLTLITLPAALPTIRRILGSESGPVLNQCLATTGRLLALFGLLFILGWLL